MTYPLRTLFVDDVDVVLGLVAVLPNKIYDQFAAAFILTSINRLNFIFP
jgi:hypothetical protein